MSAKRNKNTESEGDKPTKRKKAKAVKSEEMSGEVLEFIQAIDDYKRLNSRPFPNWSEVLEILKGLGYDKSVSP